MPAFPGYHGLPAASHSPGTPQIPAPALLEAADADTQPGRLAQLARCPDWRVRAQVAEHPRTPFEIVGLLSHDECPEVVAAVVARPDLPLPILHELFIHHHAGVRAGAAEHPALPHALQAVAAMDPAVQVRLAVANRGDLLDGMVRLLAGDAARVVRAAVLANPTTPRWIWRRGLQDPAPGNRLVLLERPDISPGAALALAADERLYRLPGAEELIKAALRRALQGLRPTRRRQRTGDLLDSRARVTRAATIEALTAV